MKLIPSFTIDHTKLMPGIYESRVDVIDGTGAYVTTFDIRMKRPNVEPAITPAAMHTIEHIVATYIRDDEEWKDKVIYWGPMGCLTGSYLIVKGRPKSAELLPLMIRAYDFLANYTGEIPGATDVCCGNYKLQDLEEARKEARLYLDILRTDPGLEYPI